MKEFIEDTLHQQINMNEYQKTDKLPLALKGYFYLYTMEINGQVCLLAKPKEEADLAVLRRSQRRLEQLTGLFCVLYLTQMNYYSRDKMLEEGIPFIWENRQIYMPFLGILLRQNEARMLKPCTRVSFLTQKLLLTALYNGWQDVTVTLAAKQLNVSKMSITRCFDEMESLGIPLLGKKGRTRYLTGCLDKKKMWREIEPYMRKPLICEYYLEEDISEELVKSGISALSEYSLLEDNEYVTCAITKLQLKSFNMRNRKCVPKGEVPGCVVQELGYIIDFKDVSAIDPLTVLMLMESKRENPRVDKALEEMLENYVW